MNLPEHPLDSALRQLGPEAKAAQRLEVVWTSFEAITGVTLRRPPTTDQRRAVQLWLRSLNTGQGRPEFYAQFPHLTATLHDSVREKASRLTQVHCHTCPVVDVADAPLSLYFPVGVEPWAAQSSPHKVALREAVNAAMLAKKSPLTPWGNTPVCLSVTALVPQPSGAFPRKDVDNLVKGLLDALQGYLYPDDDVVQHLSARRLEYAGPTGIYLVAARPTGAPDIDVVYDDAQPPLLASGHVTLDASRGKPTSATPESGGAS